jgi:Sec-independent protein translocase protein TatA
MDKVKIIIIILCFLLLGRSVLPQSFKTVSQPTKHFSIGQSYGAQGQTTPEEPDDDDDEDESEEDDDEED